MLINKLRQLLSSQFLCNIGWLGTAELTNRIFRLATIVTLGRMFTNQDYGLIAVIYTTIEFSRTFTINSGIGAKIIQAEEQEVKTICDTAYWLNWILCVAIFIIQCLAAFPIAKFYNDSQLILPICVTAFTYLMLPAYMVQSAMIQRENRLKIIALCNATQSIISNIITVILAFLGIGIWAIVWAILLSNPVLILIIWNNHSWRPPKEIRLEKWKEIANFGKNMLGVDILSKLRTNIDYLLIGKFLGMEALGLYYFAFNAGVGISWNVMNSFFSALFPHLCEVKTDFKRFKKRYLQSLKIISIVFVPLVTIQCLLAPFYVPIIFGEKWIPAIPVLIIICLSVIPQAFWWASTMILDAMDKTHISLAFDIIFTILFSIAILISVKSSIIAVATAVLISSILTIPILLLLIPKQLKNYAVKLQVFY